MFGRRWRRSQDQVSKSVARLPDAGRRVWFRFRVRETAVAAPAAGGHSRGAHEDTAAPSAQDIVDARPEERPDQNRKRSDDDHTSVQQQNPTSPSGTHTGRTQIAGGAVRTQQGVSGGGDDRVVRAEARRAAHRHQSRLGTTAAPPSEPEPATEPATETNQHTARRAPAEQRQKPARRRHRYN